MNIIAIIQARLGSKRYPNKILKKINDLTILEILIKRLKKSKFIHKYIVGTTKNKIDDKLVEFLKNKQIDYERGSETDVLNRYYQIAKKYNSDIIVRITADCPLIDAHIVDQCIKKFLQFSDLDYVSNKNPPTFPDGFDTEVFSYKVLENAHFNASTNYDKEHVTPYIYNSGKFNLYNIESKENNSKIRITLDEPEDFKVIKNIVNNFKPNLYFDSKDIINFINQNPSIVEPNIHINRDEGSFLDTGSKLWKRAERVFANGNMLLSKNPKMFLLGKWPSYYSKAKDVYIWDLDNKKYLDMAYMGVGTNILGYSNKLIDKEIKSAISKSNLSSLNCPEEVFLAEKLIGLHPWAEMVQFARTGAEANAVAIRIARSYAEKNNIAFCGYHGWHDWYISSNLNKNNNLSTHLLDGIKTNGVEKKLKNTAFPFKYNDFEYLKKIVEEKNIGVIIMEVERNIKPKNNFLQKVRNLATKKNIVLIFDECSSGFRETYGGLHLKYKLNPDIAMFGKALGNGYAINAVIGKRDIMLQGKNSFISSTFWTERIGSVAGLKTLEIMKEFESYNYITKVGKKIKKEWDLLSKLYSLPIKQRGLDAICGFDFLLKDNLKYKTLITQEMLKVNILASNTVYVSLKHEDEHIQLYIEKLEKIFKLIYECENGLNIDNLIKDQVSSSGFSRLN